MNSKDIIIELMALTGQFADFQKRLDELKEQIEPGMPNEDYVEELHAEAEAKVASLSAELHDVLSYLRAPPTP